MNQERESRAEAAKSIGLFFYPICKTIKGRKRSRYQKDLLSRARAWQRGRTRIVSHILFFVHFCPTFVLPILLGGERTARREGFQNTAAECNSHDVLVDESQVTISTKR